MDNPITKIKKVALDGWVNLWTLLGSTSKDKTTQTHFVWATQLVEQDMSDLFRGEGFAKRVVNLPVQDMTRKGFTVEGDTDGVVVKEFEARRYDVMFRNVLRWARVYGGAVMVMWIDDGRPMDEEINKNQLKKIDMIKIFERYRVDRTTHIVRDPNDKDFLTPIKYVITPQGGDQFTVHKSRVLVFDGLDLPDIERHKNNGWGDSVYQAAFPQIRRLGTIYANIENIVEDFQTGKLSIEGLQDMIASGQEQAIKTRIDIIDRTKHVINTMLLDSKEKYEKESSTVTGLPELIDRYAQALSNVVGIPLTLLMGTSPKGLNATGESDITLWYDNVASMQEELYQPNLQTFLELLMLSKQGPTKGKVIDNWKIKFNSLWQATDKEQAETRKSTAETDKIYIDSGVLSADEVAVSRFGGDEYSAETQLQDEDREKMREQTTGGGEGQ